MRKSARVGLLLLAAACGRGEQAAKSDTTAMSTPALPSAGPAAPADTVQDTAKAPAPAQIQDTTKRAAKPAKAGAKPAAKPANGPTPELIALGDSVFHGQVGGGTCSVCHGQDAKGTAVAPDLTDQQWLNGDGSYQFMVNTVMNGVPHPKQHPAPMPPKGGAPLTDKQVQAAAAYEYSLSHKQ